MQYISGGSTALSNCFLCGAVPGCGPSIGLPNTHTKTLKMKLPLVVLVWLIILVLGIYFVNSYPKMPVWFAMGMYLAMLVVCTSCSVMILWVLKAQARRRRERRSTSTEEKGFCSCHSHLDHTGVWLWDSLVCYYTEGSNVIPHLLFSSRFKLVDSYAKCCNSTLLYLSKVHKVFFVLKFLRNLLANFGSKI